MSIFKVRYSWLFAVPLCALACDQTPEGPHDAGELRMGVLGEDPQGNIYRLRDGVFDIDGPTSTVVSTEDPVDPVDTLSVTLFSGDYEVALADGWRLERFDPGTGDSLGVDAELVSDNPVAALINGGAATTVTYTFFVADVGPVTLGDGTLEIDIDVETVGASCDPAAQDCPAGEGCYPGGDGFVCAESFGGALLEPCEYSNWCDAGLVCVLDPICAGGGPCCAAYCVPGAGDCPLLESCHLFDPSSPEIGYCGL